ncbi:MAG: hypothetical protein RIT45_1322 [Pseudomonadota bacterium]|jgi:hypothetical protein
MPTWLDAALTGATVAAAAWWVWRRLRTPACAACPSATAPRASTGDGAKVALGATRMGRRAAR